MDSIFIRTYVPVIIIVIDSPFPKKRTVFALTIIITGAILFYQLVHTL